MPTLFLDIESRSRCSLRDSGSWRYCADPSTEPLYLCWAVDDGDVQTWRQGDPKPAAFYGAASAPADWIVVAHNFGFEIPFCELILGPRYGFPVLPLDRWHCTMRLALASGFPGELGLLAQALDLPYAKDPRAIKALREVTRPKKKGDEWDEDPVKLALVRARCVTDVEATRAIWTSPTLRHLNEPERRLQIIDAGINRRGVMIDRAFVSAARAFSTNERNAINVRLSELTDGVITSVDQVKKIREAVNALGHAMESLGKRSVSAVLARGPDDMTQQLLQLRRDGARSSVRKFAKILNFADDRDDRLRGTLVMNGASTGRWTAPGPMLHNLKRNEIGAPLSVLDAVVRNDRAHIVQFGNPLTVISNVSRGMLRAKPGHLLYSADLRMIESRVLAWVAGEEWKLELHREYDRTGDKNKEPYRVLASHMLNGPIEAIGSNERQQGKFAELAAGFGGGVGAWRRIFDDQRPDAEIESDKNKWRSLHPAIVRFWHRLFKAVTVAVRVRDAVRVNEAPLPEIVCSFEDTLYIILPSGRSLTYPNAKLVPGKFEGTVDVAYHDNSKKQWRETRAWYGMIVENVVSGIARDLLAEAIVRFEARDLPVVFHWHDDCVCEVPEGKITDSEFLAVLLEPPTWADGLPLAGSVHSGPHYLPAADEPVKIMEESEKSDVEEGVDESSDGPAADDTVPAADPVDQAINEFIAEPASIPYEPAELRTFDRDDSTDELDNLEENAAPLYEIADLAITTGSAKVCCPFHEDNDPSCILYADHYWCFACHARGDRIDWLTQVEGMTRDEAVRTILEWDGERRVATPDNKNSNVKRALALWNGGKPIASTLAERYLAETRKIAVAKLPDTIADSLRFYDQCPFGKGVKHPCLIALMTDPAGTPCGIHRIALTETEGKVDKIGRMALGALGTVRFWPANGRLVIGEGIETVLAAATHIRYRETALTPAWAAISDGGVKGLPVIDGVSELILLVDHDRNNVGQQAAKECEQRWRRAGREVVLLMPKEVGWDFNDVIMRKSV